MLSQWAHCPPYRNLSCNFIMFCLRRTSFGDVSRDNKSHKPVIYPDFHVMNRTLIVRPMFILG
jgi:hypothetical protein